MRKQIDIPSLPVIGGPERFFSTDKILSVDVIQVGMEHDFSRLKHEFEGHFIFKYNGKAYMVVLITGSPENIFLKLKNGMKIVPGAEYSSYTIFFDGNLNDLLAKKKVYDISKYYRKNVEFMFHVEWLIDMFVKPYTAASLAAV
jgi:hypothetical protein